MKRKDANEAVKQITAANNLLDTWIGRFELGRLTWKRERLLRLTQSLINVRSGEAKPSNCLWITCRLIPIFRPCITIRGACGKE
jgi:hypothetical protein